MNEEYQHALQWLIGKFAISDKQDLQRAANAIMAAQKRYPTYYTDNPASEIDVKKKEVFEALMLSNYLKGSVGTNYQDEYDQDVVRKETALMVLEREARTALK